MPIHIDRIGKKEELFSVATPDEVVHIAATRLRRYLVDTKAPLMAIALDEQLAHRLVRQGGIDTDHLATVDPNKVLEPAILMEWADGHHTVADGNHRLIAAYVAGARRVPAYLVAEKVWRRFALAGTEDSEGFWRSYLAQENPLSSMALFGKGRR